MRSLSSTTLPVNRYPKFAGHLHLLALLVLSCCVAASGQAAAGGSPPSVVDRGEASVGFNFIRSNAPPGGCTCFNALGGYGSAGFHLTNWLAIEGEVTGQHTNDIGTLGQNLTLLTYAAGPKVSLPGRRFVPFVQGLFGEAQASDSYFPTANGGSTTSANSFALQVGAGLDINLSRHFGIRVINAEFLRTTFPNGSDNTQNHLSLGAGLIARFGNRNNGPKYKPMPPAPYVPVPPPPPPAALAIVAAPEPVLQMLCSADVSSVDQGTALELTAKSITVPEDLPVTYTWTSDHGKIVGTGHRVLLDTAGLSSGEFVAHGHATATASKPIMADCDVHFRIKTVAETIQSPTGVPPGPPYPAEKEREFHENVQDALFDSNSAVIRADTLTAIIRAKFYLDRHPEITVLLGGFADTRGSSLYNLKLGMRRAIATRDAMIGAGIAPERLQIVTYGKEVQVCTAKTEECLQRNRRVVFSMHP